MTRHAPWCDPTTGIDGTHPDGECVSSTTGAAGWGAYLAKAASERPRVHLEDPFGLLATTARASLTGRQAIAYGEAIAALGRQAVAAERPAHTTHSCHRAHESAGAA